MNKPNPKPRKYRPYDYGFRNTSRVTPTSLAAEYAELRTRTPGGRG